MQKRRIYKKESEVGNCNWQKMEHVRQRGMTSVLQEIKPYKGTGLISTNSHKCIRSPVKMEQPHSIKVGMDLKTIEHYSHQRY